MNEKNVSTVMEANEFMAEKVHAHIQTELAKKARDALPQEPAICKFFAYSHLPPFLQSVSEPFCALVDVVLKTTVPGAEQSACLRKLLEAKDCAVRAALP